MGLGMYVCCLFVVLCWYQAPDRLRGTEKQLLLG